MTTALISLQYFLIILHVSAKLILAQDVTHFIYHGFHGANLHLDGITEIRPNGLLQLTNTTRERSGHAFYRIPLKFSANTSSSSRFAQSSSLSFSTIFAFAIVPEWPIPCGHGLAFIISPSMNFTNATSSQYLGIFNAANNGNTSNHVFGVELDTINSPGFQDISENHVGIDVNGLRSIAAANASYFSNQEGTNKSLQLISGSAMQLWIDYDHVEKLLNVTLAPISSPKPIQPLLSTSLDLSLTLLDTMYVGFSSATASIIAGNHYILGWSFNKSGPAQSLEISRLPSFPRQRRSRAKPVLKVTVSVATVFILLITFIVSAYILRRKKYEEILEDWEKEFGPQRFSYKDLYKATKGFKDRELLGAGGFGKVYRGVLPSSNLQVAVKKVSHDSTQGIKEFVAEIATMGKLRHRNLVALLGYCRRKGELLLVYDYMPHGSLDKFLFDNEEPKLHWDQRYRIVKGIASGLLYLHEEWEQVVLHRDVKASNVLLDADLNGRLGDFGLARLYDHGSNPQTTHVVGTVGYLAPELTAAGKATTSSDVFAFGMFMLEVACGRRPTELGQFSETTILVDEVFQRWKQGVILEASDPRLQGDYVVEEMELVLKLGLLCSKPHPEARPSMRQVMQYLDGDAILPELSADEMVGMGSTEAFSEFVMSFPSSLGRSSANTLSSSESILFMGR